MAEPDDPENVTNAKEKNLELSFPWILQEYANNQYNNHKLSDNNEYQFHHPVTNSDVHLCLFDHFHEKNASSKLESLRKIGCVLELKGVFNS